MKNEEEVKVEKNAEENFDTLSELDKFQSALSTVKLIQK